MKAPKIGIVLTVKNEERLLRNHILYHLAIGAEHIFVYFDNTTDSGKESIANLKKVTFQDSIPTTKYSSLPFLKRFVEKADAHHTARQCLNTYDALKQAEKMGLDWLLSIDADELICTDTEQASNLSAFFSTVEDSVEVVYFQVLEALQRSMQYNNVFQEEVLFKQIRSFKYRWNRSFKTLYNPFTKTTQKFSWWYGQHLGKGAIRTHREIIPHNVHRYKLSTDKKLESIQAGYILHYHAYDSEDFIKKFQNFKKHPDQFLSGNKVKDFKLLLRDIVNQAGYSKEQLLDYYQKYLLFNEREVEQLLANRNRLFFKRAKPILKEVKSPQVVFNSISND